MDLIKNWQKYHVELGFNFSDALRPVDFGEGVWIIIGCRTPRARFPIVVKNVKDNRVTHIDIETASKGLTWFIHINNNDKFHNAQEVILSNMQIKGF